MTDDDDTIALAKFHAAIEILNDRYEQAATGIYQDCLSRLGLSKSKRVLLENIIRTRTASISEYDHDEFMAALEKIEGADNGET